MGAYLLYKLVNPGDTGKAEVFLDAQEEQEQLEKFGRGLWFWTKADRAFELQKLKERGVGCPDFAKVGEGKWKASGFNEEGMVCYPLVAELFRKLHKHFQIKVFNQSCALDPDYFTIEQMKAVTKNGAALSGGGAGQEEALKLMGLKATEGNLGKGWFGQSKRHSEARRKASEVTFHSEEPVPDEFIEDTDKFI